MQYVTLGRDIPLLMWEKKRKQNQMHGTQISINCSAPMKIFMISFDSFPAGMKLPRYFKARPFFALALRDLRRVNAMRTGVLSVYAAPRFASPFIQPCAYLVTWSIDNAAYQASMVEAWRYDPSWSSSYSIARC